MLILCVDEVVDEVEVLVEIVVVVEESDCKFSLNVSSFIKFYQIYQLIGYSVKSYQ